MAGVRNILLANHLRHVDTHNRVQEEREMWRLRKLETNTSFDISHKSRTPLTRGRLLSDNYGMEATTSQMGGINDEDDTRLSEEDSLPSNKSYYWTRQLMKAEEADSHRWGHAGYKELHPEEFVSTSGDEEVQVHKNSDRCGEKRKHKHKKLKKSIKKKKHLDDEKNESSNGNDIGLVRKKKRRLKEVKKKKSKLK